MAGLDWFELDVSFHDDPKVRALASRLRQPLADAYVSRLYAYCYKHAVDRFDPQVAADTIEDAVKWKGRRGVLVDALFAVEVLERESGKVVVHGVAARLGPHLAHRQAAAERQRRRRDKAAESIGRDAHVTRDVPRDVPPDEARESQTDRDRDQTETVKQQRSGGLPTRDELRFAQHPLAASLRQRLAEEWPGLGWTKRAESDNAAVARCGLDACAAACLAYGRSSKVVPESLGFFSALLADLRPAPALVPDAPRKVPVIDLAWLEQLPEPARSEARAEWAQRAAQVEGFFAAPMQPQALANAADALRLEYAQ